MTRRQLLVKVTSGSGLLGGCSAGTLPSPRTVDRPNFLFLLSDQHRPDCLGRNLQIPVPTPNIDRLAERGADFTQAIVASPVFGPSRSCPASGMEYENCGVEVNRDPYDPQIATYYKHLRDGGYHTMATGKIDLHKGSAGRTLDGRQNRVERGFSDMQITAGKGGGTSANR